LISIHVIGSILMTFLGLSLCRNLLN
jgi:hypothetical protein